MSTARTSLTMIDKHASMLLRRLIFGGSEIALYVTWEQFACCQVRVGHQTDAKRLFGVRKRDVFMNAQSPHKWLSTLKSVVFGHCLLMLAGVADRCKSWFVRLIFCQIILTAILPGSQLICCSRAIRLIVLSPLHTGRVRSRVSLLDLEHYVWVSQDSFLLSSFLEKNGRCSGSSSHGWVLVASSYR